MIIIILYDNNPDNTDIPKHINSFFISILYAMVFSLYQHLQVNTEYTKIMNTHISQHNTIFIDASIQTHSIKLIIILVL